jgi:DNA polymerase-3 subunit delta'
MVERRINEKTGKRQAEINVEEIRALNAFLRLTPSLSPWRVAIIDAVDDLNRNAANALLKSLEEPGGRTVIFLVNHARGRLLPTIRSRCRRLALAPLDDETIDRALAADEKVTEADRHLIIDLVQGSLGRALSLTGSGAMETLRMAWDVLRQWPDYDVERLHGVGESVAARGQEERFAQLPLFLAWWWRRYFRRASGIDMPPLLEGEEELARKWAACSLDHWAGKWEKISELFARVESANADRKTVWLTALLSLVP